jgi:hypothetical protein
MGINEDHSFKNSTQEKPNEKADLKETQFYADVALRILRCAHHRRRVLYDHVLYPHVPLVDRTIEVHVLRKQKSLTRAFTFSS